MVIATTRNVKKDEIMWVWKLCSLVWVCQKYFISTYGCDMTVEIYAIPRNQYDARSKVYQWYVSSCVVSSVKLVANSSTTKAQSTGLAHAILVPHSY
jgi:hypothetical protein